MIVRPPARQQRAISDDYFRIRDFEYAQPLYDLAFLLEVEALRAGRDVPKYRIFSLWKAAYRLDGYTTAIDRWLDGALSERELDIVPSPRIRQYLLQIRQTGTLPELTALNRDVAESMLRLRSLRGYGAAKIAELFREDLSSPGDALADALSTGGYDVGAGLSAAANEWTINSPEKWQAAHVIPPLLRFLREVEVRHTGSRWTLPGMGDGIRPVTSPFTVGCSNGPGEVMSIVQESAAAQPLFRLTNSNGDVLLIQHQLGWAFNLKVATLEEGADVSALAVRLDPFTRRKSPNIRGDLHVHSTWSDGSSDIAATAARLRKTRCEYFALTDHSRSCKLQGGLTPVIWLRQAVSLKAQKLRSEVLHGIEVDILPDGRLDLPLGLLRGMDIVIGSVHGGWSGSAEDNTLRLIRAIESRHVDVIGHPTAAVLGKPGVPNYERTAVPVDWKRVFRHCAQWRVALEINCFPSRLDLGLLAAREAIAAGCWLSIGSDAHARAHLDHLRFGEHIASRLNTSRVLNRLQADELRGWISDARALRQTLTKTGGELVSVDVLGSTERPAKVEARINQIQALPRGSAVVGIDLTAGHGKATGVAFLQENQVETTSLLSDDEIVEYISRKGPAYVSIDSPLGLPGGGTEIDAAAGIVRVAERELASIGVPAYPALIDSMRDLTLRGIALKQRLESMPKPPLVIESYPGAAQDILGIPRKQKSLGSLREGLRELGLMGPGLETRSHDEMDAITSAIVGRYFESGDYEPMGIPAEAQLIVPKIRPLTFSSSPVICLAGRRAAGKSTIARYLAVFYGFRWLRTRDVIRALLLDDIDAPESRKLFNRPVDRHGITEADLHDFGLIILKEYHQVPLRRKLMEMIATAADPLVVDAMRDDADVDRQQLQHRATTIWFVETSAQRRVQRIRERSSATGTNEDDPIDANIDRLRQQADAVIENNSTLEELRWKTDNQLFELIELAAA